MSQSKELQIAAKRAAAAFHRNEMTRQLDAMRREVSAPKEEQRIIRFACAVTGKKFAAVYKRGGPADLYRIAAIEPGAAPARTGAPAREAAAATFPLAEFDHSGWRCPWCSAGNFVVSCGCGDNICNGRTRVLPSGEKHFTCHDACGRSASLSPASDVRAEDRKPASGRRAIQAPPERIALPKSGDRR